MSAVLLASVIATASCARPHPVRVPRSDPTQTPAKRTPAPTARPHATRHAEAAPGPAKVIPSPPTSVPAATAGRVLMSWYGYGPGTASGETYSRSVMACAGASRFPMRSRWHLTNPRSRRSVVIRVNDRGAFESMGRSFDCTPGVWSALGFDLRAGVVTVEASAA